MDISTFLVILVCTMTAIVIFRPVVRNLRLLGINV